MWASLCKTGSSPTCIQPCHSMMSGAQTDLAEGSYRSQVLWFGDELFPPWSPVFEHSSYLLMLFGDILKPLEVELSWKNGANGAWLILAPDPDPETDPDPVPTIITFPRYEQATPLSFLHSLKPFLPSYFLCHNGLYPQTISKNKSSSFKTFLGRCLVTVVRKVTNTEANRNNG